MTNPSQSKTPSRTISPSLIEGICLKLARNQRVRRTLSGGGRVHIDRQLPFLCVYRRPPDTEDLATERLVTGEASYLVAPGEPAFRTSVSALVRRIVETLSPEFGAFLVVEIWAGPAYDPSKEEDPNSPSLPKFKIHAGTSINPTVDALTKRLKRVKVLKQGVEVEVVRNRVGYPPHMRPLLTGDQAASLNCSFLGISVPPVYRDPNSPEEYPLLARAFRRPISLALRQAYFEFASSHTTHSPPHYHSLGRNAVVKVVWDVDQQLAEVSDEFDYLLQCTPVNTFEGWRQFQKDRFEKAPEFYYRPLPVDPTLLKRKLFNIPIERVEDPALQHLFQEKQEELELKLTMLRDRDTSRFLHESLQLFGTADDGLVELAKDVLNHGTAKDERNEGPKVNATKFAKFAEAEFEFYRQSFPEFGATCRVTSSVSGLIVSRGVLLINSDMSIPASRVEALIAHEVGTHLLTYYNAQMQPLQQLHAGLASYEELQEGLAVLSEYLAGGLDQGRVRQIAARVIAVRSLTDGASFVETFRILSRDHGFTKRIAYTITMRVYRGGGLTKDVVYLRGLQAILRYVQKGGDLTPLLLGKMAVKHIPIMQELQYRNVLKPAPLVPKHLQDPEALDRLEKLRGSEGSVVQLLREAP